MKQAQTVRESYAQPLSVYLCKLAVNIRGEGMGISAQKRRFFLVIFASANEFEFLKEIYKYLLA